MELAMQPDFLEPKTEAGQTASPARPDLVSVVIPAYNYARYLPAAIDSALRQSHPAVEVIVIDDGSTDATPDIASGYGEKIRYVRQTNSGLSAARNRGLAEARSEYVVLLDADDLLDPDMIAVSLETMRHLGGNPAVIAHVHRRIDQDGRILPTRNTAPLRDRDFRVIDFLVMNRFCPAVLAKRSSLLEAGGFDPQFRASEDRDMWVRIASRHRVHRLGRVLSSKRGHSHNMSANWRQQDTGIRRVFSKASQANYLTGMARIWWLKIWSYHFYQLAMMRGRTQPLAAILDLGFSFMLWPAFFDYPSLDQKPLFRLRMLLWILRGART
ncbi:MAG: glycosyltransferase family 2 protein [Verrucomicrobia bacterium]|nr:glycosyltransferase family 2 protein [Verrucomicrobiota bacterium]